MSPAEATELLRSCLKTGGVIPGKHFRDELANEGLTLVDAYHVLRAGRVLKAPELNVRLGDWKYTVEGKVADGPQLAIVFTFRQVGSVYLITCFSLGGSWS